MTVTVTTSGPIGAEINTNLTIIEIARNVGTELGFNVPEILVGNNDQTAKEILNILTKACEDVARRVDWGILHATAEFSGNGTDTQYILPELFSRLIEGGNIKVGNSFVRGGITEDEWNSFPQTAGTPKYFRLRGRGINFYPNLELGAIATVDYVTKAFTTDGLDIFTADDNTLSLPHEVVEKNMIWRWLRKNGEGFEDQFSEYEAVLADYAGFDGGIRTP